MEEGTEGGGEEGGGKEGVFEVFPVGESYVFAHPPRHPPLQVRLRDKTKENSTKVLEPQMEVKVEHHSLPVVPPLLVIQP